MTTNFHFIWYLAVKDSSSLLLLRMTKYRVFVQLRIIKSLVENIEIGETNF